MRGICVRPTNVWATVKCSCASQYASTNDRIVNGIDSEQGHGQDYKSEWSINEIFGLPSVETNLQMPLLRTSTSQSVFCCRGAKLWKEPNIEAMLPFLTTFEKSCCLM